MDILNQVQLMHLLDYVIDLLHRPSRNYHAVKNENCFISMRYRPCTITTRLAWMTKWEMQNST